jgi:hypothetical protein
MKKLFIGLLIIAAGAAIFLMLQNKDKTITGNNFQKEQIIGKWKLDSLWSLKDSNTHFIKGLFDPKLKEYHQYEFKKDGSIFQFADDSLTQDSSRYEWTKENQLGWKEYLADTSVEVFNISLLDKDSMKLQSKDSSVLLFTKVK